MSFYRITDPKKRDAMVADYIATVKRLKQRNLNERLGDLGTGQNLWDNGAGKFATGSWLIFRPGSNGVIRDFQILLTGSSLISTTLDNGVVRHFQNCRTGSSLISTSLDDGVVRHFQNCRTGSLLISIWG